MKQQTPVLAYLASGFVRCGRCLLFPTTTETTSAMSDAQQPFGFGPLLPGMDFLQQLTQAGQASAPGPLGHWMSPALSAEDIDKRIEELKAVQFWLEQNSRALTATVQALQVQKMTLSTLQSMNVNLGELAKAFPWANAGMPTGTMAPDAAPSAAQAPRAQSANPTSPLAGWPMSAAQSPNASAGATQTEPAPASSAPAAAPKPAPEAPSAAAATLDPAAAQAAAAAGGAQALQWWGALTQQFQQIAAQALQDPMQQAALQQASSMATQWTQAAAKTASEVLQPSQPEPKASGAEHIGAAASVRADAIAPKAASTGKPAGKSVSKSAAKAGAVPSVRTTTTAALKPTAGQTVGDGQGVAPARPRRSAAARKNSG